MLLIGASDQGLCMSLTGASPVTTFLAVLRLKCSDTPCGYQELLFARAAPEM